MAKSIKVEEQVYNDLEELRGKRETFSQAVGRLIDIRRMILGITPALEGQIVYDELKRRRQKAVELLERSS